MENAEQMYNFSRKYTPINSDRYLLRKEINSIPMNTLLEEAFQVIVSDLKYDEKVKFSFSGKQCRMYERAEYVMELEPVAVAITNYRIILCGYNGFDLARLGIKKHKIVSVPIEKCTKPSYELFPAAVDIYFNKEICISIPFYTYDKNIDGVALFENLLSELEIILNVKFQKYAEPLKNVIGDKIEDLLLSNWIIWICVSVFVIIIIICAINSGGSTTKKDYGTCNICYGKLKCAICGESGLYCENAQYGAGDDHYCSKHWADCCEWHEKQKKY